MSCTQSLVALVSPLPVRAKRDALVLGVCDGRGVLRACAGRRKSNASRLPVKALLVLNDLVAEVPLSRASHEGRSPSDRMLVLQRAVAPVLVSLAILASGQPAFANGEVLMGPPRIVDGDTYEVAGARVRLFGADAPELKQSCKDAQGKDFACGRAVLEALQGWVGNSSMACEVKTKDQYGRSVSSCNVTGKGDVGAWLVGNGYGVAYRQYSKEYVPAEEQAKAAHKGLWAGTFEEPAQWRKETKVAQLMGTAGAPTPALAALPAANSTATDSLPPSPNCTIKGNINNGKKLYHVAGTTYYDSVKINTTAGEKWFCTEAEAQQAGWTRAR